MTKTTQTREENGKQKGQKYNFNNHDNANITSHRQEKTNLSFKNDLQNIIVQIFIRLDSEFEFSRSFSSMMICPEDMDDSSCLERHCSVLRMSLRWQPYSFFSTMGRDSARLTLFTSMMANNVCPSAFLSCSTLWVTCLYVCLLTNTSLKASSLALFACGSEINLHELNYGVTNQLHENVGLGGRVFVREQVVVLQTLCVRILCFNFSCKHCGLEF